MPCWLTSPLTGERYFRGDPDDEDFVGDTHACPRCGSFTLPSVEHTIRCFFCGEPVATHVELTDAMRSASKLGGRDAVVAMLRHLPISDKVIPSWDEEPSDLRITMQVLGVRTE